MHTAEPLVTEPSSFDVKIAIHKMKIYKSPGMDHILAELIQERCNTLCSEINKLLISIWNRQELPQQ
jgi:hypothetical protein